MSRGTEIPMEMQKFLSLICNKHAHQQGALSFEVYASKDRRTPPLTPGMKRKYPSYKKQTRKISHTSIPQKMEQTQDHFIEAILEKQ